MNGVQRAFHDQGLVRPRQGAVIAGVCAGVGRRFGIGDWATRALFILSLIVIPGSQILIYPLLWILMPKEQPLEPGAPYGTPPLV